MMILLWTPEETVGMVPIGVLLIAPVRQEPARLRYIWEGDFFRVVLLWLLLSKLQVEETTVSVVALPLDIVLVIRQAK